MTFIIKTVFINPHHISRLWPKSCKKQPSILNPSNYKSKFNKTQRLDWNGFIRKHLRRSYLSLNQKESSAKFSMRLRSVWRWHRVEIEFLAEILQFFAVVLVVLPFYLIINGTFCHLSKLMRHQLCMHLGYEAKNKTSLHLHRDVVNIVILANMSRKCMWNLTLVGYTLFLIWLFEVDLLWGKNFVPS